jgi:hypothetical protein
MNKYNHNMIISACELMSVLTFDAPWPPEINVVVLAQARTNSQTKNVLENYGMSSLLSVLAFARIE